MKSIKLTEQKWHALLDILKEEYPLSYTAISWKMKEKLGFTVRYHRARNEESEFYYYKTEVHLDFYEDYKKTYFLLKYSDYI